MAYDAFISYSQTADTDLVAAIQSSLERIAKPWHQRRAIRVFRDQTGLTANPGLWSSIRTTLDESKWLILVASPAAAESPWVNKELDHWLSTKSPDRIICVLSSGTWQWDAPSADFTELSTAVPAALRGALAEEPRYVDLRWTHDGAEFGLHDVRFRDAVAEMAAAVRGFAKDEIIGEDLRHHRRTRRLAAAAISGMALLTTLALVAASVAIDQRNQANQQSKSSESRALASTSLARASTDVGEALLLAAAANRTDNTVESRRALLSNLYADPSLSRVVTYRGGNNFGVSLDRTMLGTVDGGTASVWNVTTGRPITPPIPAFRHGATFVAVGPDNTTLVVGSGGTLKIFDIPTGSPRGVLEKPRGRVTAVEFSPDGSLLAVTAEPPRAQLLAGSRSTLLRFRTSDWSLLGEPTVDCSEGHFVPGLRSLAFTQDSATIALTCADQLRFFEASTGAPTGTITTPSLFATHVTISPDGQLAALTGGETPFSENPAGIVELVDLPSRQLRGQRLAVPGQVDGRLLSGLVTSTGFDGDGSHLLTSGADGRITVWDTQTGRPSPPDLPGLSEPVELAWFSGNHEIQAVTSRRIVTWSLPERANNEVRGAEFRELSGSRGSGVQAAMVNTNTIAIGMDGLILFRDLRSGRETSKPLSVPTASLGITASSDHHYLIQSVLFLNVGANNRPVSSSDPSTPVAGWVNHVVWDLKQRTMRVVGPATLYDKPEGSAYEADFQGPNTSGVDANGRALVLRRGLGVVAIDLRDFKRTIVVKDPLADYFVQADDHSFIATAQAGAVSIWDPDKRKRRLRIRLQGVKSINDLALSDDGRHLAIATGSGLRGRVTVLDTRTGAAVVPMLPFRNSAPTSIALSADGEVLAVGDSVGQTRVWDLASSEPLSPPLGRRRLGVSVADVTFGDKDRTIATLIDLSQVQEPETFEEARKDWLIFRRIDASTLRKRACAIASPGFSPADWRALTGSKSHNGSCK